MDGLMNGWIIYDFRRKKKDAGLNNGKEIEYKSFKRKKKMKRDAKRKKWK